MKTTASPVSKPYYDVLDGLRGIAALVILVFHYLEMTYPGDYVSNPLGHGFLAVDFFFCLSGFVIGYAYDGRIEGIGVRAFFRNRLIRLHPLVIAGSLIGCVGFVCNPLVDALTDGWGLILVTLTCSMALIPSPLLSFRDGALFPYNSPSWSLFLEYLANIAYALILCKVKKRGTLLALGCLCAGWLAVSACRAGWLINGWDAKTFADGFPRVAYSFVAGLIVYRFRERWVRKNRGGFLLPCLLLLGVFFFPHLEKDWLTEVALTVIGFPLILAVGAGATVTGGMRKLCLFIGRLSYPLYMTHITTVWIFGNYYVRCQPRGLSTVLIVSALIVFNLLFAYAFMRFYDEPVRAWLTRKSNQSKR